MTQSKASVDEPRERGCCLTACDFSDTFPKFKIEVSRMANNSLEVDHIPGLKFVCVTPSLPFVKGQEVTLDIFQSGEDLSQLRLY